MSSTDQGSEESEDIETSRSEYEPDRNTVDEDTDINDTADPSARRINASKRLLRAVKRTKTTKHVVPSSGAEELSGAEPATAPKCNDVNHFTRWEMPRLVAAGGKRESLANRSKDRNFCVICLKYHSKLSRHERVAHPDHLDILEEEKKYCMHLRKESAGWSMVQLLEECPSLTATPASVAELETFMRKNHGHFLVDRNEAMSMLSYVHRQLGARDDEKIRRQRKRGDHVLPVERQAKRAARGSKTPPIDAEDQVLVPETPPTVPMEVAGYAKTPILHLPEMTPRRIRHRGELLRDMEKEGLLGQFDLEHPLFNTMWSMLNASAKMGGEDERDPNSVRQQVARVSKFLYFVMDGRDIKSLGPDLFAARSRIPEFVQKYLQVNSNYDSLRQIFRCVQFWLGTLESSVLQSHRSQVEQFTYDVKNYNKMVQKRADMQKSLMPESAKRVFTSYGKALKFLHGSQFMELIADIRERLGQDTLQPSDYHTVLSALVTQITFKNHSRGEIVYKLRENSVIYTHMEDGKTYKILRIPGAKNRKVAMAVLDEEDMDLLMLYRSVKAILVEKPHKFYLLCDARGRQLSANISARATWLQRKCGVPEDEVVRVYDVRRSCATQAVERFLGRMDQLTEHMQDQAVLANHSTKARRDNYIEPALALIAVRAFRELRRMETAGMGEEEPIEPSGLPTIEELAQFTTSELRSGERLLRVDDQELTPEQIKEFVSGPRLTEYALSVIDHTWVSPHGKYPSRAVIRSFFHPLLRSIVGEETKLLDSAISKIYNFIWYQKKTAQVKHLVMDIESDDLKQLQKSTDLSSRLASLAWKLTEDVQKQSQIKALKYNRTNFLPALNKILNETEYKVHLPAAAKCAITAVIEEKEIEREPQSESDNDDVLSDDPSDPVIDISMQYDTATKNGSKLYLSESEEDPNDNAEQLLINHESGFPEISIDAKAEKIKERQGEPEEPAILLKWIREKKDKEDKEGRYLVMDGKYPSPLECRYEFWMKFWQPKLEMGLTADRKEFVRQCEVRKLYGNLMFPDEEYERQLLKLPKEDAPNEGRCSEDASKMRKEDAPKMSKEDAPKEDAEACHGRKMRKLAMAPMGAEDVGRACQIIGCSAKKPFAYQTAVFENMAVVRPFQTENVKADGNCGFRCLSMFLFGSESRHKQLREAVCSYLLNQPKKWFSRFGDDCSGEEYLRDTHMDRPTVFMGIHELQAAAELLAVHITVFGPVTWQYYVPDRETKKILRANPKIDDGRPSLLMLNKHEHFQIVTEVKETAVGEEEPSTAVEEEEQPSSAAVREEEQPSEKKKGRAAVGEEEQLSSAAVGEEEQPSEKKNRRADKKSSREEKKSRSEEEEQTPSLAVGEEEQLSSAAVGEEEQPSEKKNRRADKKSSREEKKSRSEEEEQKPSLAVGEEEQPSSAAVGEEEQPSEKKNRRADKKSSREEKKSRSEEEENGEEDQKPSLAVREEEQKTAVGKMAQPNQFVVLKEVPQNMVQVYRSFFAPTEKTRTKIIVKPATVPTQSCRIVSTMGVKTDSSSYRCISLALSGNENNHVELRKTICSYVKKRSKAWISDLTGYNLKAKPYVNKINAYKSGTEMTDALFQAVAQLFNLHVILHENERFLFFSPDYETKWRRKFEDFSVTDERPVVCLQKINNSFRLITAIEKLKFCEKEMNTRSKGRNKFDESRFEIRDCGVKGQGLFALVDFNVGDTLLKYRGTVMTANEGEKHQKEAGRSVIIFYRDYGGRKLACYPQDGELGSYANCSKSNPNARMKYSPEHGLHLMALTTIPSGTEVLWDYHCDCGPKSELPEWYANS
uniref:C2H2-type domain-containing protein n=1 Tax=Steinernema glaseri TaxID=37863 RepID=A0A1I8AEZ5_9BILA